MRNSAFFGVPELVDRVFGRGRKENVASLTSLYPHIVAEGEFACHAPHLRDLEVIFATWGMPALSPKELDQLPSLRAVFYAAGTVQKFARPFLDRGITLVSAWQANGIPVAQFTLAQILLASKCYFRNIGEYKAGRPREELLYGDGIYCQTVAILGAGSIGRKVIELLRPFEMQILVFDPFLSEESAAKLGVEKVSLEAAFERAGVVSNHLADLPATKKMLHGGLFKRMRNNATFINTGRGETTDEVAMTKVLAERPDLTALLDVTVPEPPVAGSPLFTLPNVFLSSHLAGSLGSELVRLADYCLDEFGAWERSEPLKYEVSKAMLATMA